jgi:hypothetical protein
MDHRDLIVAVSLADKSTIAGRRHARQAVTRLCEETGATDLQIKVALKALFSTHSRPRMSLRMARKLLCISSETFWRWIRDERYGMHEIELIKISRNSSECYLDEILEVMARRDKEGERC